MFGVKNRWLLISILIHYIGISVAGYIPTNARQNSIKEYSVLVRLMDGASITSPYFRDDPIGFDPSVPLGGETRTASKAETVYHAPGQLSSNEQGYQNGQENIATGETSDSERTLEETSTSLEENFREVEKGLRKLQTSIEIYYAISEKRLDEYFKHTYKEGDRTEITYCDLFEGLGEAYLTFDDISNIGSILLANKHVRAILSLEFMIYEDGRFKLTHIRTTPEFEDPSGRVLEHYGNLYSNMNDGRFIPPSKCGLKAPYVYICDIINPVYSPENVLLQNN